MCLHVSLTALVPSKEQAVSRPAHRLTQPFGSGRFVSARLWLKDRAELSTHAKHAFRIKGMETVSN
ncbi:hypothetical protein DPMN_123766 [Dreissena polymorpha]|uniref:Uncharacterized protein n=1 Tax=Dreissena polymorpha TaxID=45954 RepID=A0A9D4GS85_DREPO|nr:hypothetical protein DPMN_123766 [Dreissena polymorpha]